MAKRVLLIRHGDGPTDDRVVNHCVLGGLTPDIRRPFLGDTLGGITDDLAGAVVYGGIYNAYDSDKHPFLREEYRMIDAVLAAGLPLLGICQGAQMIAHHLGAFAGAPEHDRHEFGYYEVTPTGADAAFMPGPLHLAQWHFHTFDLPQGAVHLARSDAFENQAFRYGANAYGLQFHAEQTIEGFRRWQAKDAGAFAQPGAQSKAEQTRLMQAHDAAQADWFYGFLNGLFPTEAP